MAQIEPNIFEELKSDWETQDIPSLRIRLKKLGRLNPNDDDGIFLDILETSKDFHCKFFAAKNLGKVLKTESLKRVKKIIKKENNSEVLREVFSAVGRLRNLANVDILVEGLGNSDPKVVMQCIRGLLFYKNDTKILKQLQMISEHPNEMIRDVLDKELKPNNLGKDSKKAYTYVNPKVSNKIIYGNSLAVLKKIPDESFHLTFTSPPYYNAKDYSFYKSYVEYLKFMESIIEQIHRTTKEGAFFILNTSPIIIPRFSREYSSKRFLIPYDLHPRISKIGFDFIEEIIWKKPEASAPNRNGGFFQQRKPLAYKANHCTESVIVYRKKTHRLIDWNIAQYPTQVVEESKIVGKYFRSNVWDISPSSSKHHPAIFPLELANNIVKLYSMKGDLVLDPFAGIGTVARACLELGRNFTMIEMEKEYIDYQEKTLKTLLNNVEVLNEVKF